MYPQYPSFVPYAPYQQQYVQQQPQQPQQPQPINNYNIVRVQNEHEARTYPVAPNTSMIFKDDNAPYIYSKTMDASQLGQPIFEKYYLVKEDDKPEIIDAENITINEGFTKDDLREIKDDLEYIKKKLLEIEKFRKAVKGGEQE